jgi:hypothetical protein
MRIILSDAVVQGRNIKIPPLSVIVDKGTKCVCESFKVPIITSGSLYFSVVVNMADTGQPFYWYVVGIQEGYFCFRK